MAKLLLCDGGCGKQSPNNKGLHIANSWRRIIIKQRRHGFEKEDTFIYCGLCWDKMMAALPKHADILEGK